MNEEQRDAWKSKVRRVDTSLHQLRAAEAEEHNGKKKPAGGTEDATASQRVRRLRVSPQLHA